MPYWLEVIIYFVMFFGLVLLITSDKDHPYSLRPRCTCGSKDPEKHYLCCDLMYRYNSAPSKHRRFGVFYPLVLDSEWRSKRKWKRRNKLK